MATPFPIIYEAVNIDQLTKRLASIEKNTKPLWGKMNAAQMLAHLNIMFEMGLTDKHQPPKAFVRFILRTIVKKKLINEVAFKKNSRTAPDMIISHQPDFTAEKEVLLAYLAQLNEKGKDFFEQRNHPSFGTLTAHEWSNLFYKHIDHHLNQFAA